MSATFTPSDIVDMSKERDWPANLGMLDWDTTSIVFTKRSLIEFLKYTGTTVDTNFNNIQKLPRYATFGKLSSPPANPAESTSTTSISASASADSEGAFIPSRRVRTTPGGPHTDIFGSDFQSEADALSTAPSKENSESLTSTSPPITQAPAQEEEEEHSGIAFRSEVKPSRRVRTNPGGTSSLSNFWDSDQAQEEFKPTRRVRQGPGGKDSISQLF